MTRKPDADDLEVFRDAVRDVRPLGVAPRVIHLRKPRPRAAFRRRDELAVLEESISRSAAELEVEVGDELNFRRPGVQDGVMRKLRRGQYRVEAEIDLHGLLLPEAKNGLRGFLARALQSPAALHPHRAWQGAALRAARAGDQERGQRGAAAHRRRDGVLLRPPGRRRHRRGLRAAVGGALATPGPQCDIEAALPARPRQDRPEVLAGLAGDPVGTEHRREVLFRLVE